MRGGVSEDARELPNDCLSKLLQRPLNDLESGFVHRRSRRIRLRASEFMNSGICSKPYSAELSHRTALLSGQNVILNNLFRDSSVRTEPDTLSDVTITISPEEAKIASASS